MDPRTLVPLVERRLDEYLQVLAEMVNTDCGTYSPDGVNRIADMCEQGFRAGGWEVERRRHEPAMGERTLGDLLVGRLRGDGGPRVLLIGHMDTVFPDGTAGERPFRVDGGRATGPGVDDMKGGLLAGLVALEEGPGRLVEDHVNARRLADGIALSTPEVLDTASVETNIVFADTRGIGVAPFDLRERLRQAGLLVNVVAGKVRLVTHRDVSPAEVDEAVGIWERVVTPARKGARP